MRQERRIPTILALLILFFGLGGVITLIERPLATRSQADTTKAPKEIRITNTSDTMISVSWMTDTPTTGSIVYGEGVNRRLESDDRDREGKTANYRNHQVTIRNLTPETSYLYRIISGNTTFDDTGQPYRFSTTAFIPTAPPAVEPSYGKVLTAVGKPGAGAIVFLNVGGSASLSTIVKDSGEWLIPISTARTLDGKAYSIPNPQDQIEITIRGDDGTVSTVITDLHHDTPVPDVTLGKTYNFRELSQAARSPKQTVLGTQETQSHDQSDKSVAIVIPTHNSNLTTSKPLIRGVGVPGKTVRIVVESTPQYGEAIVGHDGRWSWAPEKELTPGTHTITIRSTNSQGKEVIKTQRFLVLKSGSQVLGEATPSGTLTPTLPPQPTVVLITPTLFPSLVPTPLVNDSVTPAIPAKQPMPRSGNTEPTILLLFAGVTLFVLGIVRFGVSLWR